MVKDKQQGSWMVEGSVGMGSNWRNKTLKEWFFLLFFFLFLFGMTHLLQFQCDWLN